MTETIKVSSEAARALQKIDEYYSQIDTADPADRFAMQWFKNRIINEPYKNIDEAHSHIAKAAAFLLAELVRLENVKL